MKVPDNAAGRKGTCKKCGHAVLVPDGREETIAPIVEPVIETAGTESILKSRRSKQVRIPVSAINGSLAILALIVICGGLYYFMSPKSKESIIADAEPSVALIKGKTSSGTGFLIDNEIIATNRHVISKEVLKNIEIIFPSAPEEQSGPHKAELLYEDPELDIAILKVKTNLNPLKPLDGYSFKRGQEVMVIGNPELAGKDVLSNAVSSGVMSSEATLDGNKYDQLSISVNPGNSGGPVLDSSGYVIGMVTLKSNKLEGTGFSIPINDLQNRVSKAINLGPDDIKQVNELHHARAISSSISIIGEIYKYGMSEYSTSIYDTIQAGGTIDQGIEKIQSKLQTQLNLDESLVNAVSREVSTVATGKHVPETAKQRLVDLWTNTLEIKSYCDRPRGSYNTYSEKCRELSDNHDRLSNSLKLLLGIKD